MCICMSVCVFGHMYILNYYTIYMYIVLNRKISNNAIDVYIRMLFQVFL